jgi:large subunit ribosomal protein L9
MKVLLKENVPTLGMKGDLVTVADGYGRNYLIPKGLALEANPSNIKKFELEKRFIEVVQAKDKERAQTLAAQIESISLTISHRAGEEGKLYGSVTNMDIAKALTEQGVEVDRKKVLLDEPIKSLGEYSVGIKIHPEVTATVKIIVTGE